MVEMKRVFNLIGWDGTIHRADNPILLIKILYAGIGVDIGRIPTLYKALH